MVFAGILLALAIKQPWAMVFLCGPFGVRNELRMSKVGRSLLP